MLVCLNSSADADKQFEDALSRWLDKIPNH